MASERRRPGLRRPWPPRWLIVGIAVLAVLLAVLRAASPTLAERMDPSFFALLGAAVVVALVPWDHINSLKWGSFEVGLDHPSVERAARDLESKGPGKAGSEPFDADEFAVDLERYQSLLPAVRGRRILWADDLGHLVAGERRLLRSMGLDVVAASSTAQVRALLRDDADFDLLISDVGREPDVEPHVDDQDGIPMEASVAFVRQELHGKDSLLPGLPVIFYSALSPGDLEIEIGPACLPGRPVDACSSPNELVRHVLRHLLFPAGPPPALADKQEKFTEHYVPTPTARVAWVRKHGAKGAARAAQAAAVPPPGR